MCQLWCVLEIIVNKLASIAESTTAYPNEMSVNAYFMPRPMSTCVLQANVSIRGVVVLDVRWVVANWIIWFIQTWKFDVLLNCQHSNMLFLCIHYRVSYMYLK